MVLNDGFQPGPDLLGYLDGNLSVYGWDDPHLAVQDFHLPWWRGSTLPHKFTSVLSFATIRACLKEHWKQLATVLLNDLRKQPADETEHFTTPTYSWHPKSDTDRSSVPDADSIGLFHLGQLTIFGICAI